MQLGAGESMDDNGFDALAVAAACFRTMPEPGILMEGQIRRTSQRLGFWPAQASVCVWSATAKRVWSGYTHQEATSLISHALGLLPHCPV